MRTPRQLHAARLSRIATLTGHYSRSFTFEESRAFLKAYQDEIKTGRPVDSVLDRVWDMYFGHRNAFKNSKRYAGFSS